MNLPDKYIELLGAQVPARRMTVEEREALELLSVRAATEALADSRQKYLAARIFFKTRLNQELPAWRSKSFAEYEKYFDDDYPAFEDGITELLQDFYTEVDLKKTRRQAKALEAASNGDALRAILSAAELTLEPFRKALTELERDTGGQN